MTRVITTTGLFSMLTYRRLFHFYFKNNTTWLVCLRRFDVPYSHSDFFCICSSLERDNAVWRGGPYLQLTRELIIYFLRHASHWNTSTPQLMKLYFCKLAGKAAASLAGWLLDRSFLRSRNSRMRIVFIMAWWPPH